MATAGEERFTDREMIADNHHIYMDDTGFKYEVLLTKVDTKKNRNERYALTVSPPLHPFSPPSFPPSLHPLK